MYIYFFFFFFNDPRPTEIYPLPLHAALPISLRVSSSLTGDKPAVTNSQVIIESTNIWRPFASDKEAALRIRDFANPDLTYEKKHELNLGLDLGFLDNRINLTFDWYTRNNYDLIGPRTTNGTKGQIVEFANRRVGKECRSRWSPYH